MSFGADSGKRSERWRIPVTNPSTDLVSRLREHAEAWGVNADTPDESVMNETAMARECARAANEIERLNEQLMKAFGIWPNGSNVHSGTCGHEPKEGNEHGSSY